MIMKFILWILFFFISFGCKDDPNPRGDYIQNFLYEQILQIPDINPIEITRVEPRRIHPSFTVRQLVTSSAKSRQAETLPAGLLELEVSYPASFVLLSGKNFDPNKYAHSIYINDIPAKILYIPQKDSVLVGNFITETPTVNEFNVYQDLMEKYNPQTDIMIRVPAGVTTGVIKVLKPGGVCNSWDGKFGPGCASKDVYVDCYSAFREAFGPENMVEFGQEYKQKYNTTDTKAFRYNLQPGKNFINISCKTIFSVKHFTRSCIPIEKKINDSTLLYAPTSIEIEREEDQPFTVQFLITSGDGECSIIPLKESIY